MSPLSKASTRDLREILQALCKNNDIDIIKSVVSYLKPNLNYDPNSEGFMDALFIEIQWAKAFDLRFILVNLCENEKIKRRVDAYLEALGHSEPAEVNSQTVNPPGTIKNATAKDMRNIMLALCEDDDIKKRVAIHLRILRRSRPGGAASARGDPAALIHSATDAELRAIGLGDEDIKKRFSDSLRILHIFGELHESQAAPTSDCRMS